MKSNTAEFDGQFRSLAIVPKSIYFVSQNVINSMGGMEVFLPLLEQVEYDESKSCEIMAEEKSAREFKIEKTDNARFAFYYS